MSPVPHPSARRIFLSYGHRDATDLALRLRDELESAGHAVWQDEKRIRAGHAWTDEIRQGLRECDLVIALLSPHSVRRKGWEANPDDADSVCLDEIEYAVDACKVPVLPVMAVTCEPPFRIYRLQYVDFRAWQESGARFDALKTALLAAVVDCIETGRAPLRQWDRLPEPWDFTAFLAERRHRFTGREWLFDALRQRLAPASNPMILLTGSPGVGKSAFFASLVHANPDGQILAYHCCQAASPATLSPAVFVRSLAAMIASRDAAFAGMLEHPDTLAMLEESRVAADPASAFEAVILNLLRKLPAPETRPRLLVIDALDEALAWPGAPNVVDLLSTRLKALPDWLKVVATTRDEPAVKRRLRGADILSLDAATTDNAEDLRRYVSARLDEEPLHSAAGDRRDEVRDKVLARATGNFLVVSQTLDAVASGLLGPDDLDELAPGLEPLYAGFFDRLFARAGIEFAPTRTVLQCLIAAQTSPSRDELAAITGLDAEADLPPMLARLASMVPPRDGRYSPFHKTLVEWLTGWNAAEDQPVAGEYYISPTKGHRLWADALMSRYSKGPASWTALVRRDLPTHLIGAGQWDDVVAVLLDLRFLEAKIRGPGTTVFDIVADFEQALRRLPEGHDRHRLVFLVSEMLRLDAAFLAGFPESLFQCLWNRGHWHDCADAAAFLSARAPAVPPWSAAAPRVSALVAQWRVDKDKRCPGHTWLRSLRPLPELLGSAQRSVIRLDSDSFDSVAVSPDGERIVASLSGKGIIGAWDAHSGAQLALVDLPADKSVHCVRFLASGPRNGLAAAVTWDGRLVLLDDALHVVEAVQGTEDNFGRVAVSADGTRIATGDWKGVVALWGVEDLTLIRRWQAHAGQINALEFSPCGQYLASGESSFTQQSFVRLWAVDVPDPPVLAEASSSHSVESVCFSADGTWLYWGDYDGAIDRWAWRQGEHTRVRDAHDSPASVVRLFGEHHLLCGVGGAFNPVPVEVWNLADGTMERQLHGHLFGIGDIALVPGTPRFVSAGDSTLRLWDLGMPAETELAMLEPEVSWVAFREPQGWVITASETSDTVWVRTIAEGSLVLKLEGHADVLGSVALSHDGRLLACGAADGNTRLWDLDSGTPRWEVRHHDDAVTAMAFSPDDGRLATGGKDGRVNLIDAATGALEKCSRVMGEDWVHSIAVSHDGKLVASGGYSSLQVWDIDRLEARLKLENVMHYGLWFAPEDDIVIVEGMSQFGAAWTLATGEPVADGAVVEALYHQAVNRAGCAWRWSTPGNIGYAQEYLKLVDDASGATVAAFPELRGGVQWHPGGRIWVNKRSRQITLLRLEGP